ncbi:PRC and DUF2382 domain-containing protein [Nocardia sp. NPDC050193]
MPGVPNPVAGLSEQLLFRRDVRGARFDSSAVDRRERGGVMVQKVEDLIGDAVYDTDGDKIGKVKRVYVNNASGAPTWAAVSTGLFSGDSLVPLAGAQLRSDDDQVQVRVDKQAVKSAPHLEHDGLITDESERELFVHYGIDPGRAGWDDFGSGVTGRDGAAGAAAAMSGAGSAGAGPASGDEGGFMVRSEEQLDLGTEKGEVGRARLRKYVVTEEQSVTVPMTHEEVRVEREPITDATSATAEFAEDEQEVILHEERLTAEKRAVPVERVRLAVDEVEEDQTIADTVRKERIDTDGVEHGDEHRR